MNNGQPILPEKVQEIRDEIAKQTKESGININFNDRLMTPDFTDLKRIYSKNLEHKPSLGSSNYNFFYKDKSDGQYKIRDTTEDASTSSQVRSSKKQKTFCNFLPVSIPSNIDNNTIAEGFSIFWALSNQIDKNKAKTTGNPNKKQQKAIIFSDLESEGDDDVITLSTPSNNHNTQSYRDNETKVTEYTSPPKKSKLNQRSRKSSSQSNNQTQSLQQLHQFQQQNYSLASQNQQNYQNYEQVQNQSPQNLILFQSSVNTAQNNNNANIQLQNLINSPQLQQLLSMSSFHNQSINTHPNLISSSISLQNLQNQSSSQINTKLIQQGNSILKNASRSQQNMTYQQQKQQIPQQNYQSDSLQNLIYQQTQIPQSLQSEFQQSLLYQQQQSIQQMNQQNSMYKQNLQPELQQNSMYQQQQPKQRHQKQRQQKNQQLENQQNIIYQQQQQIQPNSQSESQQSLIYQQQLQQHQQQQIQPNSQSESQQSLIYQQQLQQHQQQNFIYQHQIQPNFHQLQNQSSSRFDPQQTSIYHHQQQIQSNSRKASQQNLINQQQQNQPNYQLDSQKNYSHQTQQQRQSQQDFQSDPQQSFVYPQKLQTQPKLQSESQQNYSYQSQRQQQQTQQDLQQDTQHNSQKSKSRANQIPRNQDQAELRISKPIPSPNISKQPQINQPNTDSISNIQKKPQKRFPSASTATLHPKIDPKKLGCIIEIKSNQKKEDFIEPPDIKKVSLKESIIQAREELVNRGMPPIPTSGVYERPQKAKRHVKRRKHDDLISEFGNTPSSPNITTNESLVPIIPVFLIRSKASK